MSLLKFLSFVLLVASPLLAAPNPGKKPASAPLRVPSPDTAQVRVMTCVQDSWLPRKDSTQVCLVARGKSRRDSLYLEYRVFAPGKNFGLLQFAYPPIDSSPVWHGNVENCPDEASCRLKFFTQDWIALTSRKDDGLSVAEFPSILNTRKMDLPGCDPVCKNRVMKEAIHQVQQGRSRHVMLFTHPFQGHGPFIYVPSQDAFVWMGLNDLVDEHGEH